MYEMLSDIIIGSNEVTLNVCAATQEIPLTIDDPLAAVGRVIAEVFSRVFAAGALLLSAACSLVYIIPGVIVLNVEVISQRGLFSLEAIWATIKANLLFLKLLLLGNLALVFSCVYAPLPYQILQMQHELIISKIGIILEKVSTLHPVAFRLGIDLSLLPDQGAALDNWRGEIKEELARFLANNDASVLDGFENNGNILHMLGRALLARHYSEQEVNAARQIHIPGRWGGGAAGEDASRQNFVKALTNFHLAFYDTLLITRDKLVKSKACLVDEIEAMEGSPLRAMLNLALFDMFQKARSVEGTNALSLPKGKSTSDTELFQLQPYTKDHVNNPFNFGEWFFAIYDGVRVSENTTAAALTEPQLKQLKLFCTDRIKIDRLDATLKRFVKELNEFLPHKWYFKFWAIYNKNNAIEDFKGLQKMSPRQLELLEQLLHDGFVDPRQKSESKVLQRALDKAQVLFEATQGLNSDEREELRRALVTNTVSESCAIQEFINEILLNVNSDAVDGKDVRRHLRLLLSPHNIDLSKVEDADVRMAYSLLTELRVQGIEKRILAKFDPASQPLPDLSDAFSGVERIPRANIRSGGLRSV